MSQQRGANAVLIYDTETTFKTTPVTPDAIILPYKSESLRLSRNLVSSETIRSSRQPQKPVRGNMDVAGDVEFELSPQYGRMLKHIFGSAEKTGAVAPYTWTYKIATLPIGMCLEKQFTDLATPKYFLYNGLKVGSFKLSAKSEGMIPCTVSLIGAKETVGAASFDATATDFGHTPFDGFSCSLKEGGSTLGIGTEISLSLENNLDGNTYVIDGTGERYSLPEGIAKVTGTLTVLFEDVALYTKATGHTETQLEVHFTNGDGTGNPAGNEKLSFYLEELIYKPAAPVIAGPQGLVVTLDFEGYYNDGASTSALKAILLSPLAAF